MSSPTYILRMSPEEVLAFGHQLSKPDATEVCQSLGRKLQLYFSPHPPGKCATCGESLGADTYVSPESASLTEVQLEGFKAIEAQSRVICRMCLRRYYLDRGDGDPFPGDPVPAEYARSD